MAFFKPWGDNKDSLTNQLLQLSQWYSEQMEQKEDKKRVDVSNSLTFLTNFRRTANIDTVADVDNLKNLIGIHQDNASPEYKHLYNVYQKDADYEKTLIVNSKGLNENLNKFNSKWIDRGYKEGDIYKIENLNINDVLKLQDEFGGIYNTYQNIINYYGETTHLVDHNTKQKMGKTLDSFEQAIADLMQTGKITHEDWKILRTSPLSLPAIREDKVNTALSLYNRFSPLYDEAMSLDVDMVSKHIDTVTAGGKFNAAQTITDQLEPYLINPITGVIDQQKVISMSKRLETSGKLGLRDELITIQDELRQTVSGAAEQLHFWSGKTLDEIKTGNTNHDDQVDRKNITSKLLTGGNVKIQQKYRVSTDEPNVSIFKTDKGKDIRIEQDDDGLFSVISPKEMNIGTLENPTDNSLRRAKTLPDMAWYLWNNSGSTIKGFSINDKATNILVDMGLAFEGNYGPTGKKYVNLNNFIKDLKGLNKILRDKNTTKLSYENESGEKIEVDFGKSVWAGPKTKEDIELLTSILKSNKYWVNGEIVGTISNPRRQFYNNIEASLSK